MARTKQVARFFGAGASAPKTMNPACMRNSPYIQKSKTYKTKKPKDKTGKANKAGKTCADENSEENKTAVDLPTRCKSEEECKCWISCFHVSSSEAEEDSECEENENCEADEEGKKFEDE